MIKIKYLILLFIISILTSCGLANATIDSMHVELLRHEEKFTAYRLSTDRIINNSNIVPILEHFKNRYPEEDWLWVRIRPCVWIIIPRDEI